MLTIRLKRESELREEHREKNIEDINLKAVKNEARRKVVGVRTFWKDKIYGEIKYTSSRTRIDNIHSFINFVHSYDLYN